MEPRFQAILGKMSNEGIFTRYKAREVYHAQGAYEPGITFREKRVMISLRYTYVEVGTNFFL